MFHALALKHPHPDPILYLNATVCTIARAMGCEVPDPPTSWVEDLVRFSCERIEASKPPEQRDAEKQGIRFGPNGPYRVTRQEWK